MRDENGTTMCPYDVGLADGRGELTRRQRKEMDRYLAGLEGSSLQAYLAGLADAERTY